MPCFLLDDGVLRNAPCCFLFILYSGLELSNLVVGIGLHVHDGMGDLEVEQLLVNVQWTTGGRIKSAGSLLKLRGYDGQRMLVPYHDGALDDVHMDGKESKEGGNVGFLGA